MSVERFDEAERQLGTAAELDPLSVKLGVSLTAPAYYTGQHQRVLDSLEKLLELDPDQSKIHAVPGMAH